MLLKHHPDKQAEAGKSQEEAESDPIFLAIQEAFEILGDEKKRRAFDSQFEFDDSIPGEILKGDFYEVYGPVYVRNARFSEHKPVPRLGDDNTPLEEVHQFYEFWVRLLLMPVRPC